MANNTADSIRLAPCGFIRAVFRYLPMFLVALALVLLLPATAQTYSYVSQWGTAGTGSGQFNTPYGVALDSSGNVYVCDVANNRIQKFTGTGTFTFSFGNTITPATLRLNTPSAIAVNSSSGIVYVTDTNNRRIQRYDMATGAATATFPRWGSAGTGNGQFNAPVGIALDSSGNVYVADTGNNRIQKFDATGTYITKWGAAGTGNGQFNAPTGIVVDSGDNVYVVDRGNNRVQKFSSTGTYITKWGTTGAGNGQFNSPRHMSVDSSNNIYVADTGNNRIQKFDSTGTYLAQWGSSGTGNGQFTGPRAVVVSSAGSVAYVSDTGNNRIERFGVASTAPSVPGATGITTSAITFTWQDNSSDETGFKVYADPGASAPTTLRTTTASNATSWNYTGLSVNAQYSFQVLAANTTTLVDSAKTTNFSAWTLAATPLAPVVSSPTTTTLAVAIASGDGNPASTTYAIRESGGLYVQAGGTLGVAAVYQTATTWGTKTVTGLSPSTGYSFSAIGQNGAAVNTSASPATSGTTLAAVPLAPVVNNATTSTLDVAIASGDNNSVATTYALQETTGGLYVQASGTLGVSAVYQTSSAWGTKTVTGLSANTVYSFVAIARNAAGSTTAAGPATSGTTLALTPLAPVVNNPGVTTLDVTIASGDGNPAGTEYALQETTGSLYVQADTTLGALPVFQTSTGWGTVTVTSLDHSTTYNFIAIARNSASVVTSASPPAPGTTLDGDPPTAHTITPATVGPTNATSISFTVDFDHGVMNFNNAADLVIVHSGTTSTGVTITGGPQTYNVAVNGISGNGSFTLAVNTLSDVKSNTDGLFMDMSVTSAPVEIDNTQPNALAPVPASTGPTNATTMDFDVSFDEAVQNFDSVADLTIVHTGTASTGAVITGGPINYTVTLTGISGDGSLTLAVNPLTGIQDIAGNDLATGPASAAVTFDHTSPNALAPVPASTGPTGSTTMDFAVSFDEDVQNFDDISDLTIVDSGTVSSTGAVITGGPRNYTVTVTGISGDGSFTLAVNTLSDVQDLVGNPLGTAPDSAAVVIDNTRPGITIGSPTPDTTAAGPVTFTVTYTGATSTSLDAGDITLNTTGTVLGVLDVTGSGNVYTVTVSSISGDGTFTFSIAAGTAVDAQGDLALAAGPSPVVTVSAPHLSLNMGVPVAIVLGLLGAFALRRRTAR